MANKFNLMALQEDFEAEKPMLLADLGKASTEFFKHQFPDGGFTDKGFEQWPDRKRYQRWPLMLKSGALQQSIAYQVMGNDVVDSSDLPYSAIHNDGLQGNAWGKYAFQMPKRQFMGNSDVLEDNILLPIIKGRLDMILNG